MIATVQSFSLSGLSARKLIIECDLTNGLPSLSIVGISGKSADAAKERIRSAINNSGLVFPRKRITINLAPAGEASDSSIYDLPIALAILARSGQIKEQVLHNDFVVGELGLDGNIRGVRGILSMVQATAQLHQQLIAPRDNLQQLNLFPHATSRSYSSLSELYAALTTNSPREPQREVLAGETTQPQPEVDFSEIVGQHYAKRVLEIAAAGNHNLLMSGPPGTGKSMLAKAVVGILPPMNDDEIAEVSQIYSLVSSDFNKLHRSRPFRSPHHSASHAAIVGGSQHPRPGEISLSHLGVLFLDEAPEFSKQALESLRQPMEDQKITLSRASRTVEYPADFMLVATMNPCPCGYYGDPKHSCTCTMTELIQYQKKLSGPILDRIDLQVRVDRLEASTLFAPGEGESSEKIRSRVLLARSIQNDRFGKSTTNNAMTSAYIRKFCKLSPSTASLLEEATDRLQLSARSHFKVIRVARTIADLAQHAAIAEEHIAEALQYRLSEPSFSTVNA